MKICMPRLWLVSCAIALASTGTAALAGEGSGSSKSKAAQSYSTYRETGLGGQFDDPSDRAHFSDLRELTQHLLRTAVRMTKYHRPEAPPMVSRVPRRELEQLGCGEAGKCGVSAMYISERGVLMAEDLQPETNLFHRSILLHELIHYLQDVGQELATLAACERWYQRELEAYAVQKRYLQDVHSPDRVAYSGARPVCAGESDVHTHNARLIKAPGVND
jgi:hypothetical protein